MKLSGKEHWRKGDRRVSGHLGWAWGVSVFGLAFKLVTPGFAAEAPALTPPVDLSRLPPPATNEIVFARDIKPIFERSCFRCHGPERPKSGLRLDTRETALKGGYYGVDIIPGRSEASRLVHLVAGLNEEIGPMPPKGRAEPLSRAEVALVRAWIDQGALWESVPPAPRTRLTFTPAAGWIGVSGDAGVFREHHWLPEGWNGGAERFEWQQRLDERSRWIVEGHAWRDDYRLTLSLDRKETGFVRAGAEQYRKYFSDRGGRDPRFEPDQFRLGRDLHLDIGRAWVDLGLRLPDWPQVTVGYEYQFKEGAKSTLQWGPVTQGQEPDGSARTRNLYPAFKDLDEQTHLLKFDLDHEIAGVRVEESFRGEFYHLRARRRNAVDYDRDAGGSGPSRLDEIKDGHRHFHGANTFRLERSLTDWLFASAGYLYSHLDAQAAFRLDNLFPTGPAGFGLRWRAPEIVLERDTHVFNLNSQLGPWRHLVFSAGAQSEWSRQKGFGQAVQDFQPPFGLPVATLRADLDKASAEEHVGLRYTGLPGTVLFAEARLHQESLGQFEEKLEGDHPFLRDTDASSQSRDWRAGFTTSPWRSGSFGAHYRWRERDSSYDHRRDSSRLFGYSALIRDRQIDSEEVEARLVLHPAAWLKTTLSYKLVATDYRVATDPVAGFDPETFDLVPGFISPGTRRLAGNHDAHIYSLNATFTPFQRLYLSSTLSVQDSRTVTARHGARSVVPLEGQVYSWINSGTFVWTPRTDLTLSYAFAHADYRQHNRADGLPLGLAYQQHTLQAGLTRQIRDHLRASLRYGFFLYDESGRTHFDDYTAHAVFATVTVTFP